MKARCLQYDIIRIPAILMVIITHVSAYMVLHFPGPCRGALQIGSVFSCIVLPLSRIRGIGRLLYYGS